MIHTTKTITAKSRAQTQSVPETQISREQLQEHWLHLRIKKSTLIYLQQVLDLQEASLHTQLDAGVAMALVATRARASEKRGKGILAEGEEFFVEELRVTFLEGLNQHCVETLRVVLGTFAALQMHFLPSLLPWPSATWLFTCLGLALIVLLIYVGCISGYTLWRNRRAGGSWYSRQAPPYQHTPPASLTFPLALPLLSSSDPTSLQLYLSSPRISSPTRSD